MSLRESQQTGRLRLRHLLEVTEARGEEMAEQRHRFDRLRTDDARPRAISAFNLFQTPENLAARLAGMLPLGGRILEPSAGLGRLYRAVRARDTAAHMTLVEIAPQCAGELYRQTENDGNCRLIQGDFLDQTPEILGQFTAIIMNPPFKQGRDIKHILHAQSLLEPSGKLVALCANGPRQRQKLQPLAAEWYDLPAGTFKEEATNVAAALLVINAAR